MGCTGCVLHLLHVCIGWNRDFFSFSLWEKSSETMVKVSAEGWTEILDRKWKVK